MCIFWERNIGEDCRMSVKTGGKIDRYLKNNAAQARQEKKYRSARFSRWRGRALSWAYLAPSLIGVGLFFVLPFGVVIYYSLINNPVQHDFVGYSNFVRTWENNAFQLAARNTLIFSFAAVPLAVVLSLWLAVIMESRIPLKSTFRTFFLSPMMVPIASVILVWQVLFDYNGLVNAVISRIGIGKVDWLKSYYGPVVIILLFLWKNLGYNMILFMSGLSSVPKDQIEVARLESATETQIFWKIKLRYLSSTIMFVIIMSLINSFKVFREVYLLAGNYPFDSLYTMQHYMNNTFQSLDYQKLSSAAIIMAAFMMVVIGILLLLEDWFGRDLEQ
jgi:multiple sugar transport system permease protein